MSAGALEKAIDTFGIRSVLNLRGHGQGRDWYSRERAVCRQADVAHATVTFDVDEWPPRPASLRFMETIESLDKPVLMHCHRGVDRTGWAAGVVVLVNGGTLEDGEAQLSPSNGHICIRSKCPQHHFFEAYSRWLSENGGIHSGTVFRRWVAQAYCPDPWNAGLELISDAPREAVGGSGVALSVKASNQGREPWHIGAFGVRLGIRMIGPLNSISENPGRLFFDRRAQAVDLGRCEMSGFLVSAGQSRVFEVKAKLPVTPGLYLVQVDMVKEKVHWFSEMGWPGLVWPLEILENR